MDIGGNLKKYRKLSNLNQEQVANALGIERSTYSYYESGKSKPSVDVLIKLSALFGVELYTILDYSAGNSEENNQGGYYTKFDQSLPVNRLTDREQDLILIFRQLTEEGKVDLHRRAGIILEKEKSEQES